MSVSNFAIACMKVCSSAEHGDDSLRKTLIREGVKFWLNGLSYKEVRQIANMVSSELDEYVAQHAVEDINNRYDAHPKATAPHLDERGRLQRAAAFVAQLHRLSAKSPHSGPHHSDC